jgi:DNA-directed RNA polymerase specialized sigma24 family protein
MTEEIWPTTSGTLLLKLANAAQATEWNEAWARFVRLYGPGILMWCRRLGLRSDDAEEVKSRVLTKLHQKMTFFECRRWLRWAVQHSLEAVAAEPAVPPVLIGAGAARELLNVMTAEEIAGIAGLKGLTDAPSAAAWEAAWSAFRDIYRPVLLRCCAERWGLGQVQAQAVAERLLGHLGPAIRNLNAATLPRFRAWLHAVVRNAARDCIDELGRLPPGPGHVQLQRLLANQACREDFVNEIVLADLRQQAEEKVRHRVNPVHWQAYTLMVYDHLPGEEAARQTGLKTANIYQAAHRVKKAIQEEMRHLEGEVAADAAEE